MVAPAEAFHWYITDVPAILLRFPGEDKVGAAGDPTGCPVGVGVGLGLGVGVGVAVGLGAGVGVGVGVGVEAGTEPLTKVQPFAVTSLCADQPALFPALTHQ
jgi:hypothetical protein